jgi:hypothetical protein
MSKGSLSLVATCLDIIFNEVEPVDRLGLQGFAVVEYLLLPEVSRFIISLGEEVMKEVSAQVHQDSWYGVQPYALTLQGITMEVLEKATRPDPVVAVGSCYQLVVSSLDFIVGEL